MRRLRPLHVALLIPWMVAVVAARLPLRDNSYLWHVRAGTIQIDRGSVLTIDPFSFTFGGESWRTQSWLFELLYGWLDGRVGIEHYSWVVAIGALLVAVAAGLIIWKQCSSLVGAAILLAATSWIMAPFINPRPVVASYVFVGAVMIATSSRRLRWTLVLLAWVWASVHASYLLGIVLVGALRFRDREFRMGILDAIAMLAVSFFTAHGWGAIDFIAGFVLNRQALSFLTEWATPNFVSIAFLPVIGLLCLVVAAGMRGRLRAGDLLLLIVGLVVLFSASRSVLVGWLFVLPLAARAFAPGDDMRLLGAGAAGPGVPAVGLGLILIATPLLVPLDEGIQEERFPIEAHRALQLRVPTFHDDISGGFLAYAAYPEFKVFVDDRAELYGASFFQSLIEARSGAPAWRSLFEEFDIEQALLRKSDGLVSVLRERGWIDTHSDEHFVILVPG